MKKLLICLLILSMIIPAALAETVTLDGTVVSVRTVPVMSPVEGALSDVLWQEGAHVEVGEEAATLFSVAVYADQPGTVRLMGAVGESLTAIAERYGAVLYIEPDCEYTINASTRYAYDSEENGIIHPGEFVYLKCASDGAYTGVGRVTAVSGSNFTVEVTDGDCRTGENYYVCREEDCNVKSRIGRGSMTHAAPVAYTGTAVAADGTATGGRLYSIEAADGAHVETGDLLFRTVTATNTHRILSEIAGTVAAVYVAPGDAVTQGTVIADVYPDGAMRLEMSVSENDLRDVQAGTRVSIEFTGGATAEGEVERIAAVAQAATDVTGEAADADDDVYFTAYVRFDAPANVRYGMTAKITTIGDEQD